MSIRTTCLALAVVAAVGSSTAVAAATPLHTTPAFPPSLIGRAILPADATSPAPFSGIVDIDPAPAPGSTQPVGGFSALLSAGFPDEYWAMPDNGFGSKANSRSFILRLYEVHANWRRLPYRGAGTVRIDQVVSLRDPGHRIPFAIVNESTPDRLLTGGDFDIESVRRDRFGTFWFGDEFGPFLLHTDATGKVLEAPIPLPDVKSPDYPADYPAPFDGPANLLSSNGFEGMALSWDGTKLYPSLEGPVSGDDPATRRIYEFDLVRHRYTQARRTYTIGGPGDETAGSLFLSDLTALDPRHLVSLERDNNQGPGAVWKRGFVIDLRPGGLLPKRQVVDLLALQDPFGISSSWPARAGDFGLGNPFRMPYQTIEAVLPTGGDTLGIVNDTNFGSTGRNPSAPDYSDFIQVRVPGLGGR